MIQPLLQRSSTLLLVLFTSLTLGACNQTETPESVAQSFWHAVEQGDMAKAKQYTLAGSLEQSNFNLEANKFETQFGKAVIDGNRAFVATTHKGQHNGSDLSYQFDTVLTQVDNQWKIDIEQTTQTLVPAAMKAAFSGLGQALNQSLNNIGDTFGAEADKLGSLLGQVMDQSMKEMSKEMDKAAQEMARTAEVMTQELDKELQNAGSIYQQKRDQWQAQQGQQKPQPASLAGTIHGTQVQLDHANFNQSLELFAGDSWGFNPSLLIFLFLDENENLAGQEYQISRGHTGSQPHIHLRWEDPSSGEIKTEIASSDYDMSLIFGQPDAAGNIAGTLSLTIANSDTAINGSFSITQ